MAAAVKLFFKLQPDEDGWPPATVESVWAHPVEAIGEYVIDNIPFFTVDATIDDRVSARRDKEGMLWFEHVVHRSQNSLIRVIFNDQKQFDIVKNRLQEYGCSMEYFGAYALLTVNIPPSTNLAAVRRYIQIEHLAEHLDYEEPILWDLDELS